MTRAARALCTESASKRVWVSVWRARRFLVFVVASAYESGRHRGLGAMLGVRALLPRTPFFLCGSLVGLVFDALSNAAVARAVQLLTRLLLLFLCILNLRDAFYFQVISPHSCTKKKK